MRLQVFVKFLEYQIRSPVLNIMVINLKYPVSQTIPMKMVYSGSDPRLELLQTVPGTVWTPADSGVHHIGYWSDDVESDLATLESTGMTVEVKSYNPDGSGTLLWAYAKGPAGPRIELVSRNMEPFIAYWWETATALD